jgi:hypothetical protein
MKRCFLIYMLSLLCFSAMGHSSEITPTAILSGKYAKELFPEDFDYTRHIYSYTQALQLRRDSYHKLDSLASLEILSLWPEDEQQRFKRIISLARNDLSGDVYAHIKELGAEYAFTLNKVTTLNDIYVLERSILGANNDIYAAKAWAAKVAAIAQYFYTDFINGQLRKDFFYYSSILYVEQEIQQVKQKFNNNIGFLLLDNEEKARNLLSQWKKKEKEIKHTPERDFLYMQLEQRFSRAVTR